MKERKKERKEGRKLEEEGEERESNKIIYTARSRSILVRRDCEREQATTVCAFV